MSNIYRLIIFLPLFMIGCAPNVIDENKVKQKIDSLNMTIFSKSGDKIYSITSPNSSYDNNKLKFELNKPIINIFVIFIFYNVFYWMEKFNYVI